jgi:addiction module RelB/DinJ family antitoxin
MEKSTTLNLRVNPAIKQQAEDVLKQLGVPLATAVDMFLHRIALTGGIPFDVSLPKVPTAVNADAMTSERLRAELMAGYEDMKQGNAQDASTAFAKFREAHR